MTFEPDISLRDLRAQLEIAKHESSGLFYASNIYSSLRNKSFGFAVLSFGIASTLWFTALLYLENGNTAFWFFVLSIMLLGCCLLSTVFSVFMHLKIISNEKKYQTICTNICVLECDIYRYPYAISDD